MSAISTLTPVERRDFKECKAIISARMETFVEVGRALVRIRDNKYYRDTHKTFDSFCKAEWDMGKDYANKIIRAAKVSEVITDSGVSGKDGTETDTTVSKTPISENQSRPLTQLLDKGESVVVECWAEIISTAPVNEDGTPDVTTKHVTATVADWIKDDEAVDEEIEEPAEDPVAANMEATNKELRSWATGAVAQFKKIPRTAWLDDTTLNIIEGHLKAAGSSARARVGKAKCPKCTDGCTFCRDTGWMPKYELEMYS